MALHILSCIQRDARICCPADVQGARLGVGLLQRAPEQLWQRLESQAMVQFMTSLLIVSSLAMTTQAGPVRAHVPLPVDDQARGVDCACTTPGSVRMRRNSNSNGFSVPGNSVRAGVACTA